MSLAADPFISPWRRTLAKAARRYGLLLALLLIGGFFSTQTPIFLTAANLTSLLVNNVALLAIVALAMTVAVANGGIDLSLGAAVDLASLAFVNAIVAGSGVITAVLAAAAAALALGLFNGLLIVRFKITPFLATLGSLFIAHSVQQLAADGGNPVYIPPPLLTDGVRGIAHGQWLGVPVPLWLVGGAALFLTVLLRHSRFGRSVLACGLQPAVAFRSGLAISRITYGVYALAAVIAAVAGVTLSANVNAYVPYSGNAFLLNAIGATFIGTTLDSRGRANVLGTLLGVLLISVVGNGLLLIGWNFYWQQVGSGVLIFTALALCFAGNRRDGLL